MITIHLASRLPLYKEGNVTPYRMLTEPEYAVYYHIYSFFISNKDGRVLFKDDEYSKVSRMSLFQNPPVKVA